MSRWKVIFAVVVIFAAGAATGALSLRSLAPEPSHQKAPPPPAPPFPSAKAYIEKLDRQVQLTDDQRAKVEEILMESQERMKKLWEPISPMAREEFRRTRKEISEILTEEQREQWKKNWRHRDGRKPDENTSGDKKKEACRALQKKAC